MAALSGGADSTALLHLLAALRSSWQLNLCAAHLDHGLRGQESEQDAEFVRQQAETLGIPCCIQRQDVREFARRKRLNLEEAGRLVRQRFLADTAKEWKADRVALGHHLDDQAETVLHHLLRGSGLRGLVGIQPCRSNFWIRPLLEVTRKEIEVFLQSAGLKFRTDPSNYQMQYTRNRIRLELLPYLARNFNPRIVRSLQQLSYLARADDDYMQEQARQSFQALTLPRPEGFSWNAEALAALHPALRGRIILKAIKSLSKGIEGISLMRVKQVLSLLEDGKSGKKIVLPGELHAWRQFEQLILAKRQDFEEKNWRLTLDIPGRVDGPNRLWYMEAFSADEPRRPDPSPISTVSIMLPVSIRSLCLRAWQSGDVYRINHRRRVKKLWNDGKVPVEIRRGLPLVHDSSQIVWIPGFPSAKLGYAEQERSSFHLISLNFHPRPETPIAAWLFRHRRLDSMLLRTESKKG